MLMVDRREMTEPAVQQKEPTRITPVAANQRATMRLEMWGASRKAGLLAELIGAPVEIIAPDGTIFSSDDDDDGELE